MQSKNNKIKISVIVVCYNAESSITISLESLLRQTYDDYEVVIIDGKSTDNTINIINDKKFLFSNCKVVSEADRGIYDAMNKGVRIASGEFVYFLNAGDCFYNEDTLKSAESYLVHGCDILYGDIIYGNFLKKYPTQLSKWYFMSEQTVCHQAIFARRTLLLDNPFIEKYGLCADRHWLYRCFRENIKMIHTSGIIAYYDITGKSSNMKQFQRDSIKVIRDEFGIVGVLYVKFKRCTGKIIKTLFNKRKQL